MTPSRRPSRRLRLARSMIRLRLLVMPLPWDTGRNGCNCLLRPFEPGLPRPGERFWESETRQPKAHYYWCLCSTAYPNMECCSWRFCLSGLQFATVGLVCGFRTRDAQARAIANRRWQIANQGACDKFCPPIRGESNEMRNVGCGMRSCYPSNRFVDLYRVEPIECGTRSVECGVRGGPSRMGAPPARPLQARAWMLLFDIVDVFALTWPERDRQLDASSGVFLSLPYPVWQS
jgi:hypothetical protein